MIDFNFAGWFGHGEGYGYGTGHSNGQPWKKITFKKKESGR